MKPIICWYCAKLGKCKDRKINKCKDFVKWKTSVEDIAKMCNVDVRTIYRWFNKNETEALDKIYNLTGAKFKHVYIGAKRVLIRVLEN